MWQSTHWLPGWPGAWKWCAATSNALGQVALAADGVALGAQLQAVRLVAVGAGHAGRVHPALQERAVDEHLAVDLAVGVVEGRVEQRWAGSRRAAAGRSRGRRPAASGGHGRGRRPRSRCASASGVMRLAMRAPSANCHWPSPRSCSSTVRPLAGSAASAPACAQATWPEPGPWQASQDTFSADQVVW